MPTLKDVDFWPSEKCDQAIAEAYFTDLEPLKWYVACFYRNSVSAANLIDSTTWQQPSGRSTHRISITLKGLASGDKIVLCLYEDASCKHNTVEAIIYKDIGTCRSRPSSQTGTIEIDSEPPGADVYIDGSPVGKTPVTKSFTVSDLDKFSRYVDVKLSKSNYKDKEFRAKIEPCVTSEVFKTLSKAKPFRLRVKTSKDDINRQLTFDIEGQGNRTIKVVNLLTCSTKSITMSNGRASLTISYDDAFFRPGKNKIRFYADDIPWVQTTRTITFATYEMKVSLLQRFSQAAAPQSQPIRISPVVVEEEEGELPSIFDYECVLTDELADELGVDEDELREHFIDEGAICIKNACCSPPTKEEMEKCKLAFASVLLKLLTK